MRALSLLLLPLLLPLGCCAQTDPGATASTSSPYLNLTHYLDPSTAETSIVSDAIQQLLAYLGAESETDGEDHGEPRDDDFGDETEEETGDKPTTGLAINGLMQSFLPRDPSDDEPYLEFSIDGGYLLEVGAGATAVSVNVTRVRAKGFDTFYESDLLRPTPFPSGPGEGGSSGGVPDDGGVSEPEEEGDETVDPETVIQNSFSLRRLVIELEFTEQSGSNSGTGATSVVALPFEDAVFWDLPVRMDLVPDRLLAFPLGAFLDPGGGYLMPCFRSVLDHLEILAIGVRFGSVLAPVLLRAGGEAPPGGSSNGSGSPFVDLLTGLFVGLPIAVPIFFETTVRNILNDLLWKEEGDLDPEDTVCPYYDAATMEGHTRSDGITGVAIPRDALVDLWDFFGGGLPGVLKNYLVDETLLVAAVAEDPGGNSNSTGTGTTNNDYYYYLDENNQLLAINQVLVEPMLESSLFEGPGVTVDAGSIGHPMVLGGGESPPLVDVDTELAIGGLSAAIKLAVSDLRIVNLNTMKAPMELLEPSEDHPQLLANRLTVGMEHWPGEPTDSQTAGGIRPLGVSARIALEVETAGDEKGIGHDVTVEMGMETLSVLLEGILEVNTHKLYGFPAGDLTSPSCWLATLRRASDREAEGVAEREFEFQRDASPTGMGIADLEASLARLHLGIACNGKDKDNANGSGSGKAVCTTPEMQAWTTELLPTPEAQEGATSAMNSVLAYAGDLLSGGAVLEDPIDRMLSDAARKCPHSPTYDPSASAETETDTGLFAAAGENTLPPYEHSVGQLVFWGSLALGVLVGVALVSLVVERIVRRRNRRWLEEDCPEPMRRILSAKQAAEETREAGLNASTSAMVASPSIPFCVRWGMPLVVLGNIALFLSGHLNVGATVAISASLAGDTIAVDEFFSFSIARSTVDIWKAGGKELAILILVFSGIWPYTKQALTLWLWFVPPHRLSVSKRGSCLLWIDRLAKWSMVDIFVIVVCIAAFRVSVSSPDTLAFLPEGFYSADLLVVPRWGLYANMIAQLVSQVSSHFVIHYHRRIVAEATEAMAERARDPLREEEGPPEPFGSQDEEGGSGARDGIPSPEDKGSGSVALRFRSFSLYHGSDGAKLVVRGWISSAMAAMGLAVLVFVVVGCLLPSFSLEILGMIGIAVESGQEFEPAVTNHSIGSIVGLLWEEAGFLDSAKAYTGIAVLGALFVSTVSIVPILQAAGLLYQWFVPLTETKRNRMSVCNEILQAWQYIEVYLIALFVASWQLGPISEYMFNTYCGSLDGFFAQMVRYGVIEEEDAQCFTVQAMLEPGSIALVVAAVLLALLNSLVTKAAKQVAFDTENERFCLNYARVQCSQNDPTDDGSGTSGSSHPGGTEEKCGTVAEAKNTNPIRPIPVMFTDTYRWLLRSDCEYGRHEKVLTSSDVSSRSL